MLKRTGVLPGDVVASMVDKKLLPLARIAYSVLREDPTLSVRELAVAIDASADHTKTLVKSLVRAGYLEIAHVSKASGSVTEVRFLKAGVEEAPLSIAS